MKNKSWSLIVLAFFVMQAFPQTPSQSNEPPAFDWSWEKIQSIVGKVRAGKDLTPRPWPGNNRVAVALSFDLDNETPALRENNLSPSELSQGVAAIQVRKHSHTVKYSFHAPLEWNSRAHAPRQHNEAAQTANDNIRVNPPWDRSTLGTSRPRHQNRFDFAHSRKDHAAEQVQVWAWLVPFERVPIAVNE